MRNTILVEVSMKHPYKSIPNTGFWSRSVSRDWDVHQLIDKPAVALNERIMSAGSCFASNIVPYLESSGFSYVRTEKPDNRFIVPAENLGYNSFSAAYGNIYTPRQMVQTVERGLNIFSPIEYVWEQPPFWIDPFRPGLRYNARSLPEFHALTKQHLAAIIEAIRQSDVFIFTLGLTEGWISSVDGAVFPACPGTIAGEFNSGRHVFKNFTAQETTDDILSLLALCQSINPKIRIILTVSPVPLVATAEPRHVLLSTIYSKSVLRVAADEASRKSDRISYFPAYEIVTGPQAPFEFFEGDRRSVSNNAIETVMECFLGYRLANKSPEPRPAESLPSEIARLECEEAAADLQ